MDNTDQYIASSMLEVDNTGHYLSSAMLGTVDKNWPVYIKLHAGNSGQYLPVYS